ncbi:hypothetical protein L218DRAFT_893982 [Marasmius fiardii PR-910]|nr:hypothetical protein L218DRAFT_893982 [Marasmius fiardii PR-910]
MQTNAVAGPSSLYLQPLTQPLQPQYIKSTHDLLSQFCLKDAYDKYVKPPPTDPTSPSATDKGKGKEMVATPAADGQDQDDDEVTGKGEKKKKNSYRHLIKGVPGKHSMKKDDFLMTIMQVPPKQRVKLAPFDSKTQDAYDVTLEGLKAWNHAALIVESAQAREDRKKRKELKKLAKAQMQGQGNIQSQAGASTPKPFTPSSVPAGSASTPSSHPPRTSTPQPQPQKPLLSTAPRLNPNVHTQRITTTTPTTTTPTPTPIVPRPNSTPSAAVSTSIVHHPNPRNHVPSPVQIPTQKASTPLRSATPTTTSGPHPLSAPPLSANTTTTGTGSNASGQLPRGQKREREDSAYGPPSQQQESLNGHTNGISQPQSASKPIIGVRAGNNSVRPRPIKKQRMVSIRPLPFFSTFIRFHRGVVYHYQLS